MKRYLYVFAGLALAAGLVSCEKDEYGTEAGNDSVPNVVLKAFPAELPNDPDCDAAVRFVANNATTDIYYLAELKSEKDGRNLSDEAYAEYVIANGTKLTVEENPFDGSLVADEVVKSLYYENVITAVAVGNGKRALASTTFTGLQWNTLCTGTYYFKTPYTYGIVDSQAKEGVVLQQQDEDKSQYRLRDLYGSGNHLLFFTIDQSATNDDGTYQFARIPAQSTGLTFRSYGGVSIRDIGYWLGNDAYITQGGYESGIYEDYNCFFCGQYYISVGYLAAYQWEYFVPDN